jgi:hypothetical protein
VSNSSGPGYEAAKSWNPSLSEEDGSNITPLVESIKHLEKLGTTVTSKYEDLKTAHVANQEALKNELDSAQSDAAKSFAIKVAMATKFSQEVLKWNSMAMKSKHTQEVYSTHMASLTANIQKSLDKCGEIVSKTKIDTNKEIVDLGKKIEEAKGKIETLQGGVDTGSVACQDAKQTMIDDYETILHKLEQSLKWMNKRGLDYVKEMEEKTAEEIKKHDKVKIDLATAQEDTAKATKAFDEEVAQSLIHMKSEEDKMFQTMDTAIAASTAAHPSSTTTTFESNAQDDVEGAKAVAAQASVDLKKDANNNVVADVQNPVEATEFLSLSAGVHPFVELNAAFAAPKKNDLNDLEAAESIDTSKYSLGMTSVDAMVTKLKDHLDILKGYIRYYQVGSAQQQEIFKTKHEAIVKVLLESAGAMKVKMIELKDSHRKLMHALNLQKYALSITEIQMKAIKVSQTTIRNKILQCADLVDAAPIPSEEEIEACKGQELPPPPAPLELDTDADNMNAEMLSMNAELGQGQDEMDSLFDLQDALAVADR